MPLYKSNVWIKTTKSLSSSSATVVSQRDKSAFLRGEFIMAFDSPTLGVRSLKCSVNNDDDTLTETVYSKLGANLDVEVSTQVNGSNIELICTNNEDHEITLKMAELII